MKRLLFVIVIVMFVGLTSCARTEKYHISATRGEYFDSYYTNSYILTGNCVKFVNSGYKDTTVICGTFSNTL